MQFRDKFPFRKDIRFFGERDPEKNRFAGQYSFFVSCAACGPMSDGDHGTIVSISEANRDPVPLPPGYEQFAHIVSEKTDMASIEFPMRVHLPFEPIGDYLERKYSNGRKSENGEPVETWSTMSDRKRDMLAVLKKIDGALSFFRRLWYLARYGGKVPFYSMTMYSAGDADMLCDFFASANVENCRNFFLSRFRESADENVVSQWVFFTGNPDDAEEKSCDSVCRTVYFPEWKVRLFSLRELKHLMSFIFHGCFDFTFNVFVEINKDGNIVEASSYF